MLRLSFYFVSPDFEQTSPSQYLYTASGYPRKLGLLRFGLLTLHYFFHLCQVTQGQIHFIIRTKNSLSHFLREASFLRQSNKNSASVKMRQYSRLTFNQNREEKMHMEDYKELYFELFNKIIVSRRRNYLVLFPP